MNETELFAVHRPEALEYPAAAKSEARTRLITAAAAAAENQPAPRRSRRALVVLAPLATAAVAAPVLVVVLGGTSRPANAQVAAAAANSSTQSFRVTGTVQGSGGQPIRSTGVFDNGRGLGRMVSYDPLGPTEFVMAGGYEYVKITRSDYTNMPGYRPYRGKPWIRYPRGTYGQDEAAAITRAELDPRVALGYLHDAIRVSRLTDTALGHRYSFTVHPRWSTVFPDTVPIGPPATITLTGTVVIDSSGRVRRLDLLKPEDGGNWIRGSLAYDDYGIHVTVSPPPADQIGRLPDHPTGPPMTQAPPTYKITPTP